MKTQTANEIFYFERPDYHPYLGKMYIPRNMMMLFIEQGTGAISINNEFHSMDADHMFFLHSRSEVMLIDATPDFKCVVIGVPAVLTQSASLQMDISFIFLLMKKPCWALEGNMRKMAESFYTMFEYISNDLQSDAKTDLITSLFTFFMSVIYETTKHTLPSDKPKTSMTKHSLISRFGKLLRVHIREDHRVSYYADQLFVTPKYLTQVVKSTIGITPKDIIDRILALESLQLLKHTNHTIQQISGQLGFPDQSYFGRFFKRMFNISPIQFRQNPDMEVMMRLEQSLIEKYPEMEKFYSVKSVTNNPEN
ncbi:MAG: helix-turn-helix domain-containing protein [Bacteroidaceae bacterium]|nr:helix-turn-helix domain-containing protein [Bacteroidaceae bacterium]